MNQVAKTTRARTGGRQAQEPKGPPTGKYAVKLAELAAFRTNTPLPEPGPAMEAYNKDLRVLLKQVAKARWLQVRAENTKTAPKKTQPEVIKGPVSAMKTATIKEDAGHMVMPSAPRFSVGVSGHTAQIAISCHTPADLDLVLAAVKRNHF